MKLILDHQDSQGLFKSIQKRCRVWPIWYPSSELEQVGSATLWAEARSPGRGGSVSNISTRPHLHSVTTGRSRGPPKLREVPRFPPCNSPPGNLFQEVHQHADRVRCPKSFIITLFLTAKYRRAPTCSTVRDDEVHRGTSECRLWDRKACLVNNAHEEELRETSAVMLNGGGGGDKGEDTRIGIIIIVLATQEPK